MLLHNGHLLGEGNADSAIKIFLFEHRTVCRVGSCVGEHALVGLGEGEIVVPILLLVAFCGSLRNVGFCDGAVVERRIIFLIGTHNLGSLAALEGYGFEFQAVVESMSKDILNA